MGANSKHEISIITGIYTFESEVNFQNYLKELGVPYVLRSLASMATPVITISKDCQVTSKLQKARDNVCRNMLL